MKYLKILTAFFILFALYAPSCVNEEEMNRREEIILNEVKSDIRMEFETDELTVTSLFVYERTAKQKLSDFADYLYVLSDTALDISFREKAGEVINRSFLNENMGIQLREKNNDTVEIPIHLFIDHVLNESFILSSFSIDSINIYKPLQRSDDSIYSGMLNFSQNFISPSHVKEFPHSIKRTIQYYLIKEEKVFGSDTLKVWNIRFGEVIPI